MKLYAAHIERNPEVLMGRPIIKGTRISVELIMRKFAGGYTIEQILAAYPQLNKEQIAAVFQYAADVIANEELNEAA